MYSIGRKLPIASLARPLSTNAAKKMNLALCQLAVTADKVANIKNCVDHIGKCTDADVIVGYNFTYCISCSIDHLNSLPALGSS